MGRDYRPNTYLELSAADFMLALAPLHLVSKVETTMTYLPAGSLCNP